MPNNDTNTNPQAELVLELRSLVFERFVSDAEAARHFEVSASHMSSILNCKKPVPERIAKALGYELRWVRSSNTEAQRAAAGGPTGAQS